jgi:hypothetical protein
MRMKQSSMPKIKSRGPQFGEILFFKMDQRAAFERRMM